MLSGRRTYIAHGARLVTALRALCENSN